MIRLTIFLKYFIYKTLIRLKNNFFLFCVSAKPFVYLIEIFFNVKINEPSLKLKLFLIIEKFFPEISLKSNKKNCNFLQERLLKLQL